MFMCGLCGSEFKYVLSKPDFSETGIDLSQYPAATARFGVSGLRGFHPESPRVTRSGLPRCRQSKVVDIHVILAQKVC